MPYLSRVMLNPARPQTRRLFADPQLMKAKILGDFARQPVEERVLWRLGHRTVTRNVTQGELLILTESRQTWMGLVEQFGYPGSDGGEPEVRDYAPLLGFVALGREFAFRVRVNPVQNAAVLENPTTSESQRLSSNDGRRSLRVAHRTVAAQTAWFLKRTEKWGFSVPESATGAPDFRLVNRERLDFVKGGGLPNTRHRVRLGTATFEGRLRVTDVERLISALTSGIGPAKGYGCGLLTLAGLKNATS